MKEIWKSVIGYEGYYEVSSEGRVRSLKTGKFLKTRFSWNGYERVCLNKNNKSIAFLVHRLIAIAFIPNQESKRCVNHIDNNPINNNVVNLEWCTQKENIQHALKQGRMLGARGEKQTTSKLTSSQVLEIRDSPLLQKELSVLYGVTPGHISTIKSGKRWGHLRLQS
jgi:hypothetical protein